MPLAYSPRRLSLAALVLLLAALILISRSDDLSMWYSEAYTMFHTAGRYDQVFVRDLLHPSGFYQAVWLWRQLVGHHDVPVKLLTAFSGLLTLSLMMASVRAARLASAPAAWLVGLLLLSGYSVYYLLELRSTSLGLLGLALALAAHLRWLMKPTPARALLYALALTLAVYFSYLNLMVLALLPVHVLLRRPKHLLFWLVLASAAGLLLVLSTPLIEVVQFMAAPNRPIRTSQEQPLSQALSWYGSDSPLLALVLLSLSAVGWWTNRRHWRDGLWLALSGPGAIVFLYLSSAWLGLYTPPYMSPLILPTLLWVGLGLGHLAQQGAGYRLVTTACVLLLVFLPWQPFLYRPRYEHDSPPVRDMVRALSQRWQEGDRLLMDPRCACGEALIWEYYESVYAPSGLPRAEDGPLGTAVWYLTSQLEPPSDQEMALQSSYLPTEFFGPWYFIATRYERGSGPVVPVGAELLLEGTRLHHRGLYRLLDEVRVSSWWRVQQTPGVEYVLSLQLLDGRGQVIAQSDGPAQSQLRSVPMNAWQPDQLYHDERSLRIPDTILGGRYELRLVVYQWWDGQRLPFLTPEGEQDSLLLERLNVVAYPEG
jgi:hypothetical protein